MNTADTIGQFNVESNSSVRTFSMLFKRLHDNMRTASIHTLSLNEGIPDTQSIDLTKDERKLILNPPAVSVVSSMWNFTQRHIAEQERTRQNLGLATMASNTKMSSLTDTDPQVMRGILEMQNLSDGIGTLKRHTGDAFLAFSWAYYKIMEDVMQKKDPNDFDEEERHFFEFYQEIQRRMDGQMQYPSHYLLRGVNTATNTAWEIARIATHLAGGSISKSELKEIIENSEPFLRTLASMNLRIFSKLEDIISKVLPDRLKFYEYDESFFEISLVKGKLALHFSEDGLRRIDEAFGPLGDLSSLIRMGCVALEAKTTDADVIHDHFMWIVAVYERFFPEKHFA